MTIQGLESKPELNGRRAIVRRKRERDKRWIVEIVPEKAKIEAEIDGEDDDAWAADAVLLLACSARDLREVAYTLHAHGTSPLYRCMCSDRRVHDRGTRSMAGVLYTLLHAEYHVERWSDKFFRYQLITLYIC